MQNQETQAQKHTRIARRFIESAARYLAEGDLIQASEKLWGATAHAIKVYCISRGWRHEKYARLRDAMQRLTEETGDSYWLKGFRVAYQNHLNFYNDDLPAPTIDDSLAIVRLLVDDLLLPAGASPDSEHNGVSPAA